MSTIATTTDTALCRIGVELSGWAADGPVSVFRVHSDGSRHEVRSMSAVSGGAAFGWDYESPLSAPVTYEADDSGTTVAASAVTLAAPSRSRLTVPGLPAFGGPVLIASRPQFSRSRPSEALDIIGRGAPIVKSDVLKSASFTLSLMTRGDAEAYSLLSMLEIAPVLLLRVPGTRVTDWCYIATGGVTEVPVSRVLPPEIPATADIIETWAAWSIDCQVTDSPVGGMVGDPTSTWQALKDTGMTWQDLRDTGLTWLDVLKGEFTA